MLSTPWEQRKTAYDIVVIGSGYGGAIAAARLAGAAVTPKPTVCILERGKEYQPGEFPESVPGVMAATRSDLNPLGLYELLNYPDISVVKGSGLGGTSLINANVAIVPDREVFEGFNWSSDISYDGLKPYYQRAGNVLASNQHPRAMELKKVQALNRRAQELGIGVEALNINVNFTIDGPNPHGVSQKPCIDCGNCVTGCNVAAKNTLAMNYLPMAKNAGATIHTQTKVEWLEKLPSGRWNIHGKYVKQDGSGKRFTLEAGEVILSAGSLNSTEILLRSEMKGLSVSPALGTKFSGNGDFFGLAYNGDFRTDVIGYDPSQRPGAGDSDAPGPNIVGLVRYNSHLPESERVTIEDFSFPSAFGALSRAAFGLIRGVDTVIGNEQAQSERLVRDLTPGNPLHDPKGAMNHSMLYLVMGQDNARGVILFEAPWTERDGRIRVSWDKVGQLQIFSKMNGELRRHARALRGNFISNPTWSLLNLGHLITAHPLGGCPMGDDHLQGAVDTHHRVFAADGSVHKGLYVTDGSVVPRSLGVNPLMTISALTERFVERKVRQLNGEEYPNPKPPVSMSSIDAVDVASYNEGQLEALFRRCPSMPIDTLINQGTVPAIDTATGTIRNDRYWKGFFPKGHVLNLMSSAIFTGFKKAFSKQGAKYTGITSDTDGRIRARNSLEEFEVGHKQNGTLEPGRYVLLRYLDPPWQGFYDIFKIINEDLLIGRVYLGNFPNGERVFTFPMVRRYNFDAMTVDDHKALYAAGATPTPQELDGVWRMDAISNANHAGGIAYLRFHNRQDGTLEAHYELMGLMEGLVTPSFLKDHFQLNDFTPFHDEIRTVSADFLVGKYVTGVPTAVGALLGNTSLGLFHSEPGGTAGFYYTLTRMEGKELPVNSLLKPFLDVQLPDGVGMTFDEEMTGWYFPGKSTPAAGRVGDLTISELIPATGDPAGGVTCSFKARMTVADVNEFVDGFEHEAQISGSITYGQFEGQGPATFAIDAPRSRFHYLRVNPHTGQAEMRYHIEFMAPTGRRFSLDGTKYMQRDGGGGFQHMGDILRDFTTLFCHTRELLPDGTTRELGTGLLRFRTFENLAAVANLAGFLTSFQITGTNDPAIQLQARLRFVAFTAQFAQREYDPIGFGAGLLADEVRAEVQRGAETPDYFSTRRTLDLQAILRDTPTRDLGELINTRAVRFDFEKKRIFRDSFWKGSFAEDSLPGWEERIRNAVLGNSARQAGRIFAGGGFWKRFDEIRDGVVKGYVVNYELAALPGLPEVRRVAYPDDNRRYFKKGDPILLLSYTNDPYKMVYDAIKIIDEQNAIGVMHLGDFPNGIEFAAFVMARNNYPFENMSIEDHTAILMDPRVTTAQGPQVQGDWEGFPILLATTGETLRNQVRPFSFQVSFDGAPQIKPQYRIGGIALGDSSASSVVRAIDADTLIGTCALSAPNAALEAVLGGREFRFLLKRKS